MQNQLPQGYFYKFRLMHYLSNPIDPKNRYLQYFIKRRKCTVQVADQVFRQDVGCTTNNQLFLSFLERGALKLAAGLAITCSGIQVPPQREVTFQLRLQEVQNIDENVKKGWF